jgi:acyl-CoA reductase-like NAD-dependent aldehyde dehydrogenase
MLESLSRWRSVQLGLFAQPKPKPDWRELSPEIRQRVLRLLTLLLRQQNARKATAGVAEEGCDE